MYVDENDICGHEGEKCRDYVDSKKCWHSKFCLK